MSAEKPDHDPESENLILAWLEDESPPAERAAFERRLNEDENFRREFQWIRAAMLATREWAEDEPPGRERVDALKIPVVARVAAVQPVPSHPAYLKFWRSMAAAAIFIAGLLIGRGLPSRTGSNLPNDQRVEANFLPPQSQQSVQSAQTGSRPAAEREEKSESPPIQSAREENGKIIIETSLRGSGARALWIVDGGFQVASSSR